MLNGLDLFSGIGGLTLSLQSLVNPIAYCESDRYAQSVLLSRMAKGELPKAPIWDDIRTLTPGILGPINTDIIYGGFPCQDISIAGAGAGLGGERSGLFFEVIRLTRDLRPRFVFLENVPAITHRGLERVCMEFTSLGYDSRWTIISAGELGAPHLRERWWLLAHSNSERLQEPGDFTNSKSQSRRPTWDTAKPLLQGDVWLQAPSDVCGMDDGIRPKTHRIRSLGNAVVPIQARIAFQKLMGMKIVERS
jgi:DNA (cytosine-5)-methyltransferase 1